MEFLNVSEGDQRFAYCGGAGSRVSSGSGSGPGSGPGGALSESLIRSVDSVYFTPSRQAEVALLPLHQYGTYLAYSEQINPIIGSINHK